MNLTDYFLSHFEELQDPREDSHKIRHKFNDILIITILSTICGADGWVEICEFAKAKIDWLKKFLELPNGIPSHDTFGRVFSLIDSDKFEQCFLNWVKSLSIDLKDEIISIDGKSLRGSHDKKNDVKMLHMVSAWASNNNILLGQVKTEEKSNEITAIPELLDLLDIKGSTVTIDAMGCQKKIAKQIVDQEADYVLNLKDNHPTLCQDVKSIFNLAEETQYKKIIHKQRIEKVHDHGRTETRRYTLIAPKDQQMFGIRWPHLNRLGMVEVTRTINNEVEKTKRFFLTSLNDGYSIALISELSKNSPPKEGKIYVDKVGDKLRYIVISPDGETIDSSININIPDLNLTTLNKNKLRILAEIGKKGHIHRDIDIHKFMQASRKHWNIEINLHWTLDVSFKEDLCRVRIGNAAENLTVIRRIALNLLKQEKTSKVGVAARRKRAGWDNNYLLKVLMSTSSL